MLRVKISYDVVQLKVGDRVPEADMYYWWWADMPTFTVESVEANARPWTLKGYGLSLPDLQSCLDRWGSHGETLLVFTSVKC